MKILFYSLFILPRPSSARFRGFYKNTLKNYQLKDLDLLFITELNIPYFTFLFHKKIDKNNFCVNLHEANDGAHMVCAFFVLSKQPTRDSIMPIVARREVSIKRTTSLINVLSHLGKFDYSCLALHTKCEAISEIILVEPKAKDHLDLMDKLITEEGFFAPSFWELVLCEGNLKEILGEEWKKSAIISKDPYQNQHVSVDDSDKVGILFAEKETGQTILEDLLMNFVSILRRRRIFILVKYKKTTETKKRT